MNLSLTKTDKAILGLAIPALGALTIDPLLSLADTAFVARLGTTSKGNMITNKVTIFVKLKPLQSLQRLVRVALASLSSSASDRSCHRASYSALSR